MKLIKLLICLLFLSLSEYAHAQYYGYAYPYTGAYGYYGRSPWSYMTGYDKANFAINSLFYTVNSAVSMSEQHRYYEQQLQMQQQALEQQKSLQRYYYEGVPPFYQVTPQGTLKNPKITWGDIEKIKP